MVTLIIIRCTDKQGHLHTVAVENKIRAFNQTAQTLDIGIDIFLADSTADEQKFITAPAKQHVTASNFLLDLFTDMAQNIVSHIMSIAVIDLLKIIHIEKYDGIKILPVLKFLKRGDQRHIAASPVKTADERIPAGACFQKLLFRYIIHSAEYDLDIAVFIR